jgi:DNA-binding PadR family transcriptional regulator
MWMLLHLLNRQIAHDDPWHNCKITHLVNEMRMNHTYVEATIADAMQNGYVEVLTEDETKQKMYQITSAGREYIPIIESALRPWQRYADVMEAFSKSTNYIRRRNPYPK